MLLKGTTQKLLQTVEDALDEENETAYEKEWDAFLNGRFEDDLFSPVRKKTAVTDFSPVVPKINQAQEDPEAMLVCELSGVLNALKSGRGVLNVRTNYGTGILPTLFGAELFKMPEEMNTLPTARPMGPDKLDELLEKGVPALTAGLGGRVMETGEFFREVFSHYPKLERFVTVYHPDLQGPLDTAELLMGSEMFYLFYDEPEKLQALLELVTETFRRFMKAWLALFPAKKYASHWGAFMHKGQIVLRDDSAMNLSPAQYREFALPYDRALLNEFGGLVHFCGRGDHYIDALCEVPGLFGINMSQPEYNDMEKIYRCTVDRGLPIFAFPRARAQADLSRPGGLRHLVTC